MKRMARLILAGNLVMAALCAGTLSAATNFWHGINTTNATSLAQTNVNDATLWSLGNVPGATDIAEFDDYGTIRWSEIALAGAFAPSSMAVRATGNGAAIGVPFYVRTNLTLAQLSLDVGTSAGGTDLIRLGSAAEAAFLVLRTADYASSAYVTGITTLTGPKGSAAIDFTGLNTLAPIENAINAQTAATGLKAVSDPVWPNTDIYIQATNAGAAYAVSVLTNAGAAFVTKRWAPAGNGATGMVTSANGYDALPVTLNLNGPAPIAFGTVGQRNSFYCYNLASGSRLLLSNTNIVFPQWQQTGLNAAGGMDGSGGSVEFTATNGTISMPDPGNRSDGTLSAGSHQLKVRSDQTWLNPSGKGFLRLTTANGLKMVASIDGAALNDLSNVAFMIDFTYNNLAEDIVGGAYRSIYFYTLSGNTTGYRPNTFNLRGPVQLTGGIIVPGNNASVLATESPDWSLAVIDNERATFPINLQSNSLTAARGLRLYRTNDVSGNYYNQVAQYGSGSIETEDNHITANGAAVDVAKLEFWETANFAGATNNDTGSGNFAANRGCFVENRGLGIACDSNTLIRLRGSFNCNTRSLRPDIGGMQAATMTLVSGTPGTTNTFEVGCSRTNNYTAGTFAIGTLNIGDSQTSGCVRLVNNYLNDNHADITNAPTGKSKDGEVLLAVKLNVKAGSLLDLNGLGAGISNSLTIASDAWLDLHSGVTFIDKQNFTNFWGVGNQTAGWSNATSRVKDSSNPRFTFRPAYVSADTRTYWQARAPAGGTAVFVR